RSPAACSPASGRGRRGGLAARTLASGVLRLAQDEVNCPATPDVCAWLTAVSNQGFVLAAGVKQGVGKDGEPGVVQGAFGHSSFFVDGLCEAAHRAVVPGEDGRRQGRGRAERVAEDVTDDCHKQVVWLLSQHLMEDRIIFAQIRKGVLVPTHPE